MRDKYQSLIVHDLRTPALSINIGTEAAILQIDSTLN